MSFRKEKHTARHTQHKGASLIIRFRWWIIAISVIIPALALILGGRLTIDPDLKHYFPDTMESMVNTERIETIFGNQDLLMILFETDSILQPESLERIRAIHREMKHMRGVRRIMSLFGSNNISSEHGYMLVEPTVTQVPRTRNDRRLLEERIRSNELVHGVVVADDFRSAAIILILEKQVNEDTLFADIHTLLNKYPGEEQIHFGGLPYLRQAIRSDIQRDGLFLVPAALLLMLVFLYGVFREKRGVVLPFLVVILSSVLALSMIPLLNWKFYIISLLVPIMLIAIANDYGIHLIAKYQEINARQEWTMRQITIQLVERLWQPVLITGITTIAGISALLAHTMIPARQMAVISAIGILFALFYSLLLLPAILSLLKPSVPVRNLTTKHHASNAFLGKMARWIITQRKAILAFTAGLTLVAAGGIFLLRVDSNEENFFPRKHPVKQASRLINEKYGGSENLSVMFSGDMLDPDILRRLDHYEQTWLQMEEVDLILSFTDVVREISKALNEPGDRWYDTIPPSREAVAQYLELYNMSAGPGELEQMVDFGYTNSHMIVRINNVSNRAINKVIQTIRETAGPDEAFAAIGGYGYVRSQLADKVVTGQFYSLGIALAVIITILAVIFGSLRTGLLGSIPLLISIVLLFGIMGYTGIRLDIATALLSSVMIGVGVDYTIHLLWRFREERQNGDDPGDAVKTTLTTTGRGIIFNALSVIIGFSVLVFSSFTPIRFFGLLVVISIASCLAGAMIVLPAILTTLHKPVKRRNHEN